MANEINEPAHTIAGASFTQEDGNIIRAKFSELEKQFLEVQKVVNGAFDTLTLEMLNSIVFLNKGLSDEQKERISAILHGSQRNADYLR